MRGLKEVLGERSKARKLKLFLTIMLTGEKIQGKKKNIKRRNYRGRETKIGSRFKESDQFFSGGRGAPGEIE